MGEETYVRRLVYVSVPVGTTHAVELDRILAEARRNNGMNGVSGLLVAAPDRYVQVLEGTPEAVGYIMDRVAADPRHTDVRIVSDTSDEARVFGGWTMASMRGAGDEAEVRGRLRILLRNAPPAVRDAFSAVD